MAGRQVTRQRLEAIIASYGSDPERWPETERSGALALLKGREDDATLRDAARLDALLERAGQPQPSNMMKANLLEAAVNSLTPQSGPAPESALTQVSQPGWAWRFTGVIDALAGLRPLALGSMMALVLALGIWIGASLTSQPLEEDELFAAFGEDYELWMEFDPSLSIEETGET